MLCGCSDDEPCAQPAGVYAIRVDVTDAITGETLCGARVTARSGDREQALAGECTYSGGWGPATYDIVTQMDGYASDTKTDVIVRDLSDECPRWETVRVPVALTPL